MGVAQINRRLLELEHQAVLNAGRRGLAQFGPEYYLEALLRNQDGLPVRILHELGISLDDLMLELLTLLKRPPASAAEAEPDEAAQRALMRAKAIGAELEHEWVGQTHLLLALIQDTESRTGDLLKKHGVQFDAVCDQFLAQLAIDKATTDLAANEQQESAPISVVRSGLLTTVIKDTPRMARIWRQQQYQPEHLLAALLHRGQGRAIQILRDLDVDLVELALALEQKSEVGETASPQNIPASPESDAVIAHSRELAESLRHAEVDTEHLLLALMRIDSLARSLLAEFRLDEEGVRRQLSKPKEQTDPNAAWRSIDETGI